MSSTKNNDISVDQLVLKAIKIIQEANFPSLPVALQKVQVEITSKSPSLKKISDIVSEDVALTGKVLKSINSPFYKRASRIESVHQAIVQMGMKNFYTEIISASIREASNNNYLSKDNFANFWNHSTDCARVCQFIASYLNDIRSNIDTNQAYLAGLFHDSGIPVMAARFNDYEEKLLNSHKSREFFVELEDKSYMTNHSVICHLIAKQWHLPKTVYEAIYFHHELDLMYCSSIESEEIAVILRLSEAILSKTSENNLFSNLQDIEEHQAYKLFNEHFSVSDEFIDELCDAVISDIL
jgi:HD-like signal output (HDOD) protein